MKTKKPILKSASLKILMVLPVIILMLVAFSSCAARKKATTSQTVTVPPPPPPPPPVPSQRPVSGQKEGDAYIMVDEMPQFPRGDEALLKYIAENTLYPKEAKDKKLQGKVIVRFKVKEDGTVSDASVLRGVDPILDNESIRVVSTIPKFTPGKQNGVIVPVWYMIPITFTLKGDNPQRPSRFEVIGTDTIYSYTKEMPKFQGGNDAFMKFKTDNLKYSPELKSMGVEGVVFVRFNIEKNGTVSNIRIEHGASPALDAEALRVTKLMPAWQPGKENGKSVKFKYSIPFEFLATPRPPVIYEKGTPFVVVEEMPMFPGGDSLLLDYISKNTKYPESAKAKGIEGRVIARFCITEVGGIDRVSILKGVDPELDKEAIRVVSSLPAFKPGKQGGKPVPVWYMVPITFALSPSTDGKISPPPPPPPVTGYDEIPVFPGGEVAMYKFINSKIIYPIPAKENKISGKVSLRFCINSDGSVSEVSVIKSIDPALDAEAIRVIKLLPKWEPGKLDGIPVKVWYPVYVTFTLK